MRQLPRFVLIALLIVYVVWGSTYFAIRIGLESFPPLLMIALRFLAAGALLFGFMKWRGAPNPTPAQWRDGALVGVLLLGGGTGLVAIAEQTVASGLTAVFIAVTPLLFALWSGWFGHWPTRREWIGIAIGFAGVLLLASGAGLSGSPLGALTLLCAVICWSLGSVLSQKKLKVAPGPMGFASEMIAGGVFLLTVGLLKGEALIVRTSGAGQLAGVAGLVLPGHDRLAGGVFGLHVHAGAGIAGAGLELCLCQPGDRGRARRLARRRNHQHPRNAGDGGDPGQRHAADHHAAQGSGLRARANSV